jgi:hypothetical protein
VKEGFEVDESVLKSFSEKVLKPLDPGKQDSMFVVRLNKAHRKIRWMFFSKSRLIRQLGRRFIALHRALNTRGSKPVGRYISSNVVL